MRQGKKEMDAQTANSTLHFDDFRHGLIRDENALSLLWFDEFGIPVRDVIKRNRYWH
jgi:hypothetical protein